jgi:hypothetical protein
MKAMVGVLGLILDFLVIVVVAVIVTTNRWLDVSLWIVATGSLIGAIWVETLRRRSRG